MKGSAEKNSITRIILDISGIQSATCALLPVIPEAPGIQSDILQQSGDSRTVRNQKAFSLLEVLISLVIITIITGLAAVTLGPYWQKHQLNQATRQLMEQIQVCRTKAIIEQKTYQVKLSEQTLFRRYKSGPVWSDWEPLQLDGSAQFSMSGTSYFYSKGFASPKTITVAHDQYKQKVVININGRARFSEIF